ncbi:MAG: flavodoxin family protein [Pseudodesulfovibrio sp.]|nr:MULTISPECIES: flavodoxin family protein [Pseudodesulfovibrio]MBU4190811.1 flavodoxin family protein [Pseudomonadota bacterium]MBU4243784.1 flavodoxin family protein [Pseudomonadota bacterium]MBU4378560.1 flavodoxin family protein [Pseudomonadota bacterium]MBU4475707.1 flavodoxin family protein [Pseudomonadota bacterium]MBU4514975.1 flavodoxin family protein [Pseudomonadota bacterium]
MTSRAVIYACSHRRGGNSDRAAQWLAAGVREAGGQADILYVRDHEVRPCLACGYCDEPGGRRGRDLCVLGPGDAAWDLFEPLLTARAVLFASPIYFYHLPSMFKTWIDRSQQFWAARAEGAPWLTELPRRTARAVFLAGRPRGDKLFEGATVTLKYFLHNFAMPLDEPLAFRGVDEPDDLTGRTEREAITGLGRHAWEEAS